VQADDPLAGAKDIRVMRPMTARRLILLAVVVLHLIVLAVVVVLVAVGYLGSNWAHGKRALVERRLVLVPELSEAGRAGARAFEVHCAGCHGRDAGGTDTGPTLLDPIYRPAHHADASFVLAVRHGVAAHHWNFGKMPPVPGLKPDELASIIQYVREVQRANGVK
jgi:mono/diheme cytochrome c family protein